MDKDNSGGAPPSDLGQGEQTASNTLKDKPTTPHGLYDEFLGQSPSALGSAKDAVASDSEVASSIDLSGVRDELAKLTQSVTDLLQKQASTTRDQVMDAVGAAGDNISQSASVAQETLISMEEDMGSRIRKNPWIAVGIAACVGMLVAKMT
jgi:ElaB/YqjD/DUF883 family membrane-anchored ribosome-binding protein